MTEFLKDVSSTYWWVGVVIVGILINLVSNFLQKNLDSQLSRLSSLWRRRSEARMAKRTRELESLRASQHRQTLLVLSEIRSRVVAVTYIILSISLLFLAGGFPALISWSSTERSVAQITFVYVVVIILYAASSISMMMVFFISRQAVYKKGLIRDLQSSKDDAQLLGGITQ